MRVSISGSIQTDDEGKFATACRALGKTLASNGHTLVVHSLPNDAQSAGKRVNAASCAVDGAGDSEQVAPVDLLVGQADKARTDLPPELKDKVKLSVRRVSGRYFSAALEAARGADAIVLIGGAVGTEFTGQVAVAFGRPVLAVRAFGGAAAAFLNEQANYEQLCLEAGVSRDDWEAIGKTDSHALATSALRALNTLVANNPFGVQPTVSKQWLLLAVVVLMVLWLVVFNMSNSGLIGTAGALLTASGLGTLLRSVTSGSPVTRTSLAATATTGLLLAFGFFILYLAGAIVITGAPQQSASGADYQRSVVATTILAFGASMWTDAALPMLRERFDRVFRGQG